MERIAVIRADLKRAMELVERCCKDAFPELYFSLLLGVTEGCTYVLRSLPQVLLYFKPAERDLVAKLTAPFIGRS